MMRKHLRLGAVAVLGLGLFMTACSKNDDNGPTATPNEMKLVAHTWSITAARFTDTAVTDSVFYTDCMDDDSLNFSMNRNFKFSDGTTTCDPSLLTYGSGIWAFNAAEDTLLLKYNYGTIQMDNFITQWKVDELTDSTFQVSYADSLGHRTGTKTLEFAAKQ